MAKYLVFKQVFGRWVWLLVWLLISKRRNKLSRKSENYQRVTENMFTQMAWSLCHLLNWLWRNWAKHCAFKSASRDVEVCFLFCFFTLLSQTLSRLWIRQWDSYCSWYNLLAARIILPGDFVASQASKLEGVLSNVYSTELMYRKNEHQKCCYQNQPVLLEHFLPALNRRGILRLLLISSLKVAADTQNKHCETSLQWCFV